MYTGSITHNENTINKLYRMQYYTFGKTRIILRFTAGLALIIIAAASGWVLWLRGLLLMAGAWLVSSPDFPAQIMADNVITARRHVFPVMSYEFLDDDVTLTEDSGFNTGGSMKIEYSRFRTLLEDSEYYYMFMNRDSACMIDKASINPPEPGQFAAFIEGRTGLEFRHEKSLLAMNLDDLRKLFRDYTLRNFTILY